ncbi:hypothetical protein [Paenibacillus physcomitrellae]|uniref:Uncharacterized protein n=2 Tax=Paenibacillus physcomitrellae TaxID=1619311 RepID=A0ABQ1G3L2_9BACL|nr:hypothetical protein [Paenibacillus physcomitrellae]GGA36202.1 hypothetical protein GCM10010917_21750 [Paenibacillus physcomitrellae]
MNDDKRRGFPGAFSYDNQSENSRDHDKNFIPYMDIIGIVERDIAAETM